MLPAIDDDGIVTIEWKYSAFVVAQRKRSCAYLWVLNEWLFSGEKDQYNCMRLTTGYF